MVLRPAVLDDIPQLHHVRLSVRENVLKDHTKVTTDDYRIMLQQRGRGWVRETDGTIVAFGIADQDSRSIWALFVAPEWEGHGIGRDLLQAMVDWLTEYGDGPIWLTTEPGTRAERFYRTAGWRSVGQTDAGEVRLELPANRRFTPSPLHVVLSRL